MIKNPAKTPTYESAQKNAVAFLESKCYHDEEMDQVLVSLIRKGCVIFETPDTFRITERGMKEVDSVLNG